MAAGSQRQADLNGPSNLQLLITAVQQDADGCHGLQLDASQRCSREVKGLKGESSNESM